MDAKKFGVKSPGELVALDERDHAFLPHPLPPNWSFPVSLWPMLGEAKAKLALLEGVGRTLPSPKILLQPLASREAIQSSRLEGTYASPSELLLYELEQKEDEPTERRVQDWQEVFNYRKALDHGMTSELPLSLRLIRDMHRTLMAGVRGKDKAPGDFRRIQVAVGATRRFIPPPADRVPGCLDAFERFMHASFHDPLVDCFLAHYQFETIHPFMDGNGRIGRLLLALMIQKRCGLTKPWLYLSGYFEKHRDDYCHKLFEVSADGAWGSWIEFCLRGTIEQAALTVERCDRLRTIRESFLKKLADGGGDIRLSLIVESLFHSPFVRIAEVARLLEVTYPTAKADVKRLCDAGILRELPQLHPRTYVAQEVFDAAYADIEAM